MALEKTNIKEKTDSNPKKMIFKQKFNQKFSIQELGGALGDWGTLIPFVIGYISIVGFNPAGIFLMLGITNIILGFRFNLPLPVQPQKTIATIALANRWDVTRTTSTGLLTGIIWSGLGFTKILNKIARLVPEVSVRAIQLGLAFILCIRALDLMWGNWIITAISLTIIILFVNNKKISSALILTIFGIGVLAFTGILTQDSLLFSWPNLQFIIPSLEEMGIGMLEAGFAQLFLTLTNVMVATVQLAHDLFPEQKDSFDANTLAQSMGAMNILSPFLGGIPLCHGSGGLAAQYAFGARTGGSMIIEGIIEIIFGLFFAGMLLNIFQDFPAGILGSMLFYTSIMLGAHGIKNTEKKDIPIVLVAAWICLLCNITWGFLTALVLYLVIYEIIIPYKIKKSKEIEKNKPL